LAPTQSSMPDSDLPPGNPFSRLVSDLPGLGWADRFGRMAAFGLSLLLRFAYHLLYHPLAFTYDLAAWIVSAGEWSEWRRCVLPFLRPGPVLEIAHGTGTLSLDMADRGYAVTAVDLSPEMNRIAAAKKRRWLEQKARAGRSFDDARPIRAEDGPALVRADVRKLPFRPGIFTSAVATFPAEFLFQSEAMRAVYRALAPGGRWIIIPTAYPGWIAKRILRDDQAALSGGMQHAVLNPLKRCGFSASVNIIHRPRSRVMVILAEKQ